MATVVKSGPDLVIEIDREGRILRRMCQLLGLGHGEVHLHSEKWIEPGIEVIIHFSKVSLAGSILYCKPTGQGHRVCVTIGADEERARREPRFPIMIEGTATIFGHSESVVANGLLTDISRSGLGMTLDVAVSIESMICIETDAFVLAGEVRYCRAESEGKFRVGLEISDIFTGQRRNQGSSRVLGILRRGLRKPRAARAGGQRG